MPNQEIPEEAKDTLKVELTIKQEVVDDIDNCLACGLTCTKKILEYKISDKDIHLSEPIEIHFCTPDKAAVLNSIVESLKLSYKREYEGLKTEIPNPDLINGETVSIV